VGLWCLQARVIFGGGTVLLVLTWVKWVERDLLRGGKLDMWVKWVERDLLRGGKLDMTRSPLFSISLL
jgi:hypothetical protein